VRGDDEAMREFVTVYQHLVRDETDVALLMVGLPYAINAVLNNKVLTFLHRAHKISLPNINLLIVRDMYANTFTEGNFKVAEDVIQTAADATVGFPYLIQLIGFWLWKSDTAALSSRDVKSAIINSKAALFDNVYALMLREISDKDREFLFAMQKDSSETKFRELMKHMNVTSGYASKYRQRLIQGGLIKPTVYGHIAYAPPYFGEYLDLQIL
jgi:hypothetical protein